MRPGNRLTTVALVAAVVGLAVSIAAAWPRQAELSPTGSLPGSPPSAARPSAPSEDPSGKPRSEPVRPATERQAGTATAERGAAPIAVAIPSVGYQAPVRPVGVGRSGEMELPDDPAVLGWYRFGPRPGEPGSSVLAGHLDSVEYGVGPLVALRDVRPGDRVLMAGPDGETDRYVVSSIDRYDQQALPDELFAREGSSRLRIITCGGEYDASAGGYQLNLVVTAVPA